MVSNVIWFCKSSGVLVRCAGVVQISRPSSVLHIGAQEVAEVLGVLIVVCQKKKCNTSVVCTCAKEDSIEM